MHGSQAIHGWPGSTVGPEQCPPMWCGWGVVVGLTNQSSRYLPRHLSTRSWAPYWWVGRIVIDRKKSTTHLALHCRTRGRFFGDQTDTHSFCPPLVRACWLTGQVAGVAVAGVAFIMACLSVRPWTSSLLLWTAGAARRCEPRRLVAVRCELWWAHGKGVLSAWVADRVTGLETGTALGSTPPGFAVLPEGSGAPPGRRSGPTLPHREAKVSGVGSP